MTKSQVTRRQLLAAAATAGAGVPLAKFALGESSHAAMPPQHVHAAGMDMTAPTHAAMVGHETPAPGGPNDLDALLYPPPALPHRRGQVREYTLVASDRQIEVAKGVFYSAWTYNGTAPGPVIRATEGDLLRVEFANGGSHPHTIHFHGIHPSNMDGVFEIVEPGGSFTYEFPARPYGMQLYHCHSTPLKKHIAKGLYGAFIIDPPKPRRPAHELVMVLNGFDTDGDGANNFYGVNGPAFYYAKYPIRVRRSQTVRIYIANQSEFTELGWMGFFEVVD